MTGVRGLYRPPLRDSEVWNSTQHVAVVDKDAVCCELALTRDLPESWYRGRGETGEPQPSGHGRAQAQRRPLRDPHHAEHPTGRRRVSFYGATAEEANN